MNLCGSATGRSLLFVAVSTAALLCGCSHSSINGYEGYVEGKFVYVASPQGGRLDELSVARGDLVTAGSLLFTLDREPETAAVQQAERMVRADEARFADLETGKRPPEIAAIHAQLDQALSEKQKSADLLKSYEKQYAAGGIPETDLIMARSALESSSAIVDEYRHNIAVAELPARTQQMEAQAQSIAADRAALRQAVWRLKQKRIASPRNGLVFDTLYRPGEYVPAGSPIVQLLPSENIEARFFIPETLVGKLRIGQSITVHCDGCASSISANIVFISNQAEYTPPVIYSNENRSKLVFMLIAKPAPADAPRLHPGQPLEVTLP